ncbi:MAG: hypothetical protein ACWGOY_13215 [Anaerolineales bacterium]
MGTPKITPDTGEGSQSALERIYIQEFLSNKGINPEIFGQLTKEEQHQLMREASQYASLKLAEVESRAKFRHDIDTT